MKDLIIGIIVIAAIVGIYFVKTSNYFNRQKEEIEKQRSGIEIALANRRATLEKLNQTVNGVIGQESKIYLGVAQIRAGSNLNELSQVESEQRNALDNIRIIAEQYPELKSNTNFLQLQESINDIENTIQATRRLYNNEVSQYNGKIKSIPSCFVASIMNVTAEEYFTATETEKQDVTLSFNA